MKYVKSGTFTTKQFSIEETITETRDVIGIAQDIIKKPLLTEKSYAGIQKKELL